MTMKNRKLLPENVCENIRLVSTAEIPLFVRNSMVYINVENCNTFTDKNINENN